MPYLVNKTNGELIATILDGQTNTAATSVVLIGKQVINYGELQNENFVHILENFANSVDPSNPLTGQIWWNSGTKTMQVFDGTRWRPVTGFSAGTATPTNSYTGDQWWDTTNDQYKVYNGTDWLVVGPAYSKVDGKSGAIVENIVDTLGTKHTVIGLYHNGSLTGIISRDLTFTPLVALAGFTTIAPGITLSASVDAIKLIGTATNSDTVGNLTPSQFLRSDQDTSTIGTLSVHGQLNVGQNSELNVNVNGTGQAVIKNLYNNGDIVIDATVNNSLTSVLTVDGTTGLITVHGNPASTLGVATKGYTDTQLTAVRNDYSSFISANVTLLNNSITSTDANVAGANVAIASLQSLKAPLASPTFTGTPAAPTPTAGDNSTKIATTAFVSSSISSFDTTKIYNGTTYAQASSDHLSLVVSGSTVVTVAAGGATTATQAQNDNSTKLATTAYVDRASKNFVKSSVKYQPTSYVSDQPPDNNVGSDGDFWFQYQ